MGRTSKVSIEKCEHGVYNPDGTAKYCTVCNPIPLAPSAHIEVKNKLLIAAAPAPTKGDEVAQEQWDQTLEKKGLGLVQPITDHSEGELSTELKMSVSSTGAYHEEFFKLRAKLDGSETFMGGHQINKVRSIEREIPEWAMSDEAVRKIVLTSFPALNRKEASRKRAGRWVQFINLYYRMQLPKQIVAKELGLSQIGIRDLIRNVNRAAAGRGVRGQKRKQSLPLGQAGEGTRRKEK